MRGRGSPRRSARRSPVRPRPGRAASGAAGSWHERGAVARQPRRRRAVEGVDAGADGVHQVVDVADPQQVARRRFREVAHVQPTTSRICSFDSERAADRDAVDPGAARTRSIAAQVLVHAALHDPVEQLARRARARACQATQRSSQRCVRSIELSVYSRSTWKGVHSSKASAMSEPSAAWTSIEVSGPMKRSPPSRYERKRTPSSAIDMTIDLVGPAAPPLDLLGHRSVSHREDLVAARVGDDRPAPAHELVQPAQLAHELLTRLDEQVERVAEHHVVAQPGHLRGVERLDRPGDATARTPGCARVRAASG